MAQHIVKVVDDNTLAAGEGWVMVRCADTGDIYFLVERSRAADAAVLEDAWTAARRLEQENRTIEQAVLTGIGWPT